MHCYKTNQKFSWTPMNILSCIDPVVYVFAMLKFWELRAEINVGLGLEMPPTKEMMFLHAMAMDIEYNVLAIPAYAATLAGMAWLRLMVSFQLSETFGPIISAML